MSGLHIQKNNTESAKDVIGSPKTESQLKQRKSVGVQIHTIPTMKKKENSGRQVAPSVKCLTLGFCSSLDLRVLR